MKKFYEQKMQEIQSKLEKVDLKNYEISIELAQSMIQYLCCELNNIRANLNSFESVDEEIYFFKFIKPAILGPLLYFNKVKNLILSFPNGSTETQKKFYREELESLTFTHKRYSDLNKYYNAKFTHLDKEYFTRYQNSEFMQTESVYFVSDPNFSTAYDFQWSKIICNEYLKLYLEYNILRITNQFYISESRAALQIPKLTWTGSKAALVELGYAFEAGNFINNGKVDIKEIMQGIEILANIDLGDYYRTFTSIKQRGDTTKHLTQLAANLKKRIEDSEQ